METENDDEKKSTSVVLRSPDGELFVIPLRELQQYRKDQGVVGRYVPLGGHNPTNPHGWGYKFWNGLEASLRD